MFVSAKIEKCILIFAILGIAMIPAIYIYAINSEPYRVATSYVQGSHEISRHLGNVRKTRLAFTDFQVTNQGERGHADMSIVVYGERVDGLVQVKLQKHLSTWRVHHAILNVQSKTLQLPQN